MKQNTQMTQLGKMFVYIALMEMRNKPFELDGCSAGVINLVGKLMELDVVRCPADTPRTQYDADCTYYILTDKGSKLIDRYLKACADELTKARFGKMKWDKRSKFHKALMERIA